MIRKWLVLAVVSGMLVWGSGIVVLATELDVTDEATASPNVVQGDFFYFFKLAMEKIVLAFTIDELQDAQLLVVFANERAAEAKALAAEGEIEAAQEALSKALELQQQAVALTESSTDENAADTAADTAVETPADTVTLIDSETTTETTTETPTETATDTETTEDSGSVEVVTPVDNATEESNDSNASIPSDETGSSVDQNVENQNNVVPPVTKPLTEKENKKAAVKAQAEKNIVALKEVLVALQTKDLDDKTKAKVQKNIQQQIDKMNKKLTEQPKKEDEDEEYEDEEHEDEDYKDEDHQSKKDDDDGDDDDNENEEDSDEVGDSDDEEKEIAQKKNESERESSKKQRERERESEKKNKYKQKHERDDD
jgi:hypothetical protein